MKELYFYIAAILLLGLLLGLAWRRPNRQRLFWRLLATLGAVVGLLLLARPPHQNTRVNPTEAILLTPGYHPDSLRALTHKLGTGTVVLRHKKVLEKAQSLSQVRELSYNFPRVKRLHVLGYGLTTEELAALDSVQIILHLSPPPAGVATVDWPARVTLGEKITVTGQYYQPNAKKPVWLYLSLAGTHQDSVEIKTKNYTRFSLTYLPKQAGQLILNLEQGQEKQSGFIGQVPVTVNPKQPLQVLLLQAAPGFEFKFLKNHLAAAGHGVAIRTSLSKNISHTEWVNLPRLNLERLTPAGLRRFDLVLTDTRVWRDLSAQEQKVLTQAISEDGLGLLVLPDEWPLPAKPRILSAFRFTPAPNPNTAPRNTWWPETKKPIPSVSLPATILPSAESIKLAWQPQGLVAAAEPLGWGKVGVSLLTQTFSWHLAGKQSIYAGFWATLLGRVAKPKVINHTWHIEAPPLPYVHQPLTLHLSDYAVTGQANFPKALVSTSGPDSTTAYLAQDPILSHRYTGKYWPRETGWHQVQKPNGLPHPFYIFPDSAWIGLQQHHTLAQTTAFAQQKSTVKRKDPDYYEREPVPGIYFFLLFLACAGFLWLEEKL